MEWLLNVSLLEAVSRVLGLGAARDGRPQELDCLLFLLLRRQRAFCYWSNDCKGRLYAESGRFGKSCNAPKVDVKIVTKKSDFERVGRKNLHRLTGSENAVDV